MSGDRCSLMDDRARQLSLHKTVSSRTRNTIIAFASHPPSQRPQKEGNGIVWNYVVTFPQHQRQGGAKSNQASAALRRWLYCYRSASTKQPVATCFGSIRRRIPLAYVSPPLLLRVQLTKVAGEQALTTGSCLGGEVSCRPHHPKTIPWYQSRDATAKGLLGTPSPSRLCFHLQQDVPRLLKS